MDFSKFDSRAQAEAGTHLHVADPWTGELLDEKGAPCYVIVRGSASKIMQAKMRVKQRAAVQLSKKKKGDGDSRVMEDVHNELCEAAADFIMGFENIERGGRPCSLSGSELVDVLSEDPDGGGEFVVTGQVDVTDAMWFLGLSFPEMGAKEDEHGEPILGNDGTPEIEMKNNPFAKQVADCAGGQAKHMGNSKRG
tara:strand:- start:407 stop:991 length:585 start_codon:yes stop_codon:yes gene_type:complete